MKKRIVILYSDETSFARINRPANYSLPRLIPYMQARGYQIAFYNTKTNEYVDESLQFFKLTWLSLAKEIITNKQKSKTVLICHGSPKIIKLGYYLKKLFGYKMIARTGGVFYGIEDMERELFKIFVSQRSKYLAGADYFISTSDGTPVKLFAEKMKISKSRVHTFLNGFPASISVDNAKRMNRIVCISRFSFEKNVDYVIHSFKRALEKLNDNYTLHLVGEGPEQENLKRVVSELGIEDKVVFEGFSRDWQHYFSTSKLVLTGLSFNTILEAISVSTPVVTIDLGETKEIFKDFDSVHVVDYPAGGYGRIPERYFESLVADTAEKIAEVLNSNYAYPHIYFDENEYGWDARLEKEFKLIDKLLT